ncbi:MAG TPA: Asp-tRNA(Asn)/Glu-tRNA(Gln) amidotransferase subunit GatC [Thermoanaerobaculia bacterium]|nr:Asp-tRNA(Asn)/Glu-tRNA(Gln) amidotransferase subunit GatC [Thermoanaerobaculia bacterium]
MKIHREEARRVAGLAHLELDDAGLDRMADEMTKILSYIDQLRDADVDDVTEPEVVATPLREDEPRPSLDRDSVARNAPAWRDGLFVVPKVIGGE